MGKRPEPSATTVEKIRNYVRKYWEKTGTAAHPDPGVTEAVIKGLAANMDEVGRPLCPCNFYPDKAEELQQHGRRWVCACDEMKKWKYCHCLLFVTPEGLPVTEYLPEGHEGRQAYGLVPGPDTGQGKGEWPRLTRSPPCPSSSPSSSSIVRVSPAAALFVNSFVSPLLENREFLRPSTAGNGLAHPRRAQSS